MISGVTIKTRGRIALFNFFHAIERAERITGPILAFRVNNPIAVDYEFIFVLAFGKHERNGMNGRDGGGKRCGSISCLAVCLEREFQWARTDAL